MPEITPRAPVGRPAPAVESATLLVVDDDAQNRDLLSRRLRRQGYAVEVAADGGEALAMIERSQYDLVLLDQMMPGMSGLDLLRLLRATRSATELPVIMVTAVDESDVVVEALNRGANDYVTKPLDFPVAAARIRSQLSRKRTEEAQLREAGRAQADEEVVPGLSGHSVFRERLAEVFGRSRTEPETTFAVLQVNVDGLKMVSDSLPADSGNRMVEILIGRMNEAARLYTGRESPRVTIARCGADEFAILLENFDQDTAIQAGRRMVPLAAQPLLIDGREVFVRASIGVASFSAQCLGPEEILRDADLAMYCARDLGKSRVEVFDPAMREWVLKRLEVETDLRKALDRGEMELYYQPKMDLRTRRLSGFEALLRWNHPRYGVLAPGQFIPIAEETGLIVPIGEWVMREACRQLAQWQQSCPGEPRLTMSVNLSVKQLLHSGLEKRVRSVIEEFELHPEDLRLEVTETLLMQDAEASAELLRKLKMLHVGLKLDDFGTGYSSLNYLHKFPFDTLKIDRSFVMNIDTMPECREIIRSIVTLARALQMSVVAEGVETEAQLSELLAIGCVYGQGFLFSRPVQAAVAEQLILAGRLPEAS